VKNTIVDRTAISNIISLRIERGSPVKTGMVASMAFKIRVCDDEIIPAPIAPAIKTALIYLER
jgi:hypothetical protein